MDKQGRLLPQAEGAARHLAKKAGTWRLVPTGDDLLMLRRDAPAGAGRGLRAVLAGDLEGFPAVELLGYLAQARWTGALSVIEADAERRLYLRKGVLVWASSTVVSERLGEVLQRQGRVSRARLEDLLEGPQVDGVQLGQALIAEGLLAPEALEKALSRQFQDIFFGVMGLPRGVFFLFNDPVHGRHGVELELDVTWLLMEGMRRQDEQTRMEAPEDDGAVPRTVEWETARIGEGLFGELHAALPEEAAGGYRTAFEAYLASDEAPALLRGLSLDAEGRLPAARLVERAWQAEPAPKDHAEAARRLPPVLREALFAALLEAGRLLPPEGHRELSRRARAAWRLLDGAAPAVEPRPERAVAESAAEPFATEPSPAPAEAGLSPREAGAETASPSDGDETLPDAASVDAAFDELAAGRLGEGMGVDLEELRGGGARRWAWPKRGREAAAPGPEKSNEPAVLEVLSDPEGAWVYLDGRKLGRTPLTLRKGSHRSAHKLELRHGEGWRVWTRTLVLSGTGRTTVRATLQPAGPEAVTAG